MGRLKTKLISVSRRKDDLDQKINKFLEDEGISGGDLIDIKYNVTTQKGVSTDFIVDSALIIYAGEDDDFEVESNDF
ncbi:sporulation protein Cse60 [Bacillus sp. alh8]|uniref:sporulation protein Cse60 n=1 Tax=Bacillus sp. alh8 TaxID=3421242 RepID=UPI003D1754AD